MVRFVGLSCTGTKHMASGKKKSSSRNLSGKRVSAKAKVSRSRKPSIRVAVKYAPQHYVVCVCNEDYPASLELRKLYPVLEDSFAADHGMLRVIDESGEDYLYPSEFFVRIELPASIQQTLAKIA